MTAHTIVSRLSKGLRIAALAVLALPGLAACSTNPATGEPMISLMSSQDEQRIGRETHPQIVQRYGRYADERVQAYVAGIGQTLARQSELPDLQWTFTVLDSPAINAFALPGGYVYMTRGLLALATNEAELASVLGHEIGHVTARHAAQRQIAELGTLIPIFGNTPEGIAAYSREQELQADELGIRYMARAGYDVRAAAEFLEQLDRQSRLEAQLAGRKDSAATTSVMASHPRTPERIARARQDAAAVAGGTRLERDRYLAAIDGMEYGSGPSQGYVRGNRFLHPKLGFAFEVPPGFRLSNGATTVLARNPDGGVIAFDGVRSRGGSMTDYVANMARRSLRELQAIRVGDMDGASGLLTASLNGQRMDVRLVAIRFSDTVVYRFVFASPPSQTAALTPQFEQTVQSFHHLQAAEAAHLKPYRIRIVTAKRGDTVRSLADRLPFADDRTMRLILLNGWNDGATVRPGQKVKLIVE